MLTQFVAAFDDCFVVRYDKNRTAKEKINVRYVMGPKQRVLYDIVNQAKNLSLPVISMEQTSLKRDSSRIQNKDSHMHRPHKNDKNISKIPQPVPVNCDISVSIVANYKEDIDQIVSNFIPWCNPYFIISWKIPDGFQLDFTDELRSEVSWSGEIGYESPMDISSQDKYKIVGTTSFTIKGWIFPALETPVAPIYVVRSDFHAVATGDDLYGYDSYPTLSAIDYTTTDVITVFAYPEITNEFYNGIPYYNDISIDSSNTSNFTLYGKRFDYENKWYLSSNNIVSGLSFETVRTFKSPTISAYRLPDSCVGVVNDNISVISLSSEFLNPGNLTIITSNSAGWVSNNYIISVL